MSTWLLALLVKPLTLIVVLLPGYLLKNSLARRMKEGKWKRLLLRRIN